jgi:hypothetical protein
MQLLDCSQKYSSRWRGQIHSLLWVWLVASVRRLKALGAEIQEEPQWGIDMTMSTPWMSRSSHPRVATPGWTQSSH